MAAQDDPKAKENEDTGRPADKDTRTVRQFETDDGTPVEPSSLHPKYPVGEPDPEGTPGVHEVKVDNNKPKQ